MLTAVNTRRKTALWSLLPRYLALNIQRDMEFRSSFLVSIGILICNEALWVLFWYLFFTRFPKVNNWSKEDVVVLWSVTTTAFGLVFTICGNVDRLGGLITDGHLDHYLLIPKPPLLHVLISRTGLMSLGDTLFGVTAFLALGIPTLQRFLLYLLGVLLTAGIVLGFMLVIGALSFYVGSTQQLADELLASLIHFSTYPGTIFKGLVKLVLYSLIPAGFINMIPVYVIRDFKWHFVAGAAGMAVGMILLGRWLFYRGLRYYASGSTLVARV